METRSTAYGLVGDVRGFLSRAESDVASDVASSGPRTGEAFDGLVLRAVAGEHEVRIELALARLEALERIALHGLIGWDIDRPLFRSAEASAAIPLDGGPHTLAVLPADGRALRLWASAARLTRGQGARGATRPVPQEQAAVARVTSATLAGWTPPAPPPPLAGRRDGGPARRRSRSASRSRGVAPVR